MNPQTRGTRRQMFLGAGVGWHNLILTNSYVVVGLVVSHSFRFQTFLAMISKGSVR